MLEREPSRIKVEPGPMVRMTLASAKRLRAVTEVAASMGTRSSWLRLRQSSGRRLASSAALANEPKSSSGMRTSRAGHAARTVAERGAPRMAAISPKTSPACSLATRRAWLSVPSTQTSSSPDKTT